MAEWAEQIPKNKGAENINTFVYRLSAVIVSFTAAWTADTGRFDGAR